MPVLERLPFWTFAEDGDCSNGEDKMSLVACKECGNNLSSTAPACPTCGATIAIAAPPKPFLRQTIGRGEGVAYLVVVAAMIGWLFSMGGDRPPQTAVAIHAVTPPSEHAYKFVTPDGYVYVDANLGLVADGRRNVLVKYLGQPINEEYRFRFEGSPAYVVTCYSPCKQARRIVYLPGTIDIVEDIAFIVTPGSVLDRAAHDAIAGVLIPELTRPLDAH